MNQKRERYVYSFELTTFSAMIRRNKKSYRGLFEWNYVSLFLFPCLLKMAIGSILALSIGVILTNLIIVTLVLMTLCYQM